MVTSAADNPPLFSLVVSTLGRSGELEHMLESLERQSERRFEVIIVDQNADNRIQESIGSNGYSFPVQHVQTPKDRGLSRGRNQGWRRARGEIVLFPDDDCWYPDKLLSQALVIFETSQADIVTGRAADETGRSINGRFEDQAQHIGRNNLWTTQIEWMVFFRRGVLEQIDGYDETIGVGADTPWQACEGQDIMARALDAGFSAYFDPSLIGHHAELDTQRPDRAMRKKGRMYARGMGYVLRKHGYGPIAALYWTVRPLANLARSLLVLDWPRAAYFGNVALGRTEGFLRRTLS